MHDLTQRQVEILRSLIEEYINSAEAVGSETLEKKHNLSASPATIRNEMVKLAELGYLKQQHASAGRVPTPQAMKFYVKQLMKEKELSVAEEVGLKENVWDVRDKEQIFLRQLTKSLADKTKSLAITTTDDGSVFCAGYANVFDVPEFFDIDVTKSLFSVIDEFEYLKDIFSHVLDDEEIHVLIGEELGPRLQGPYGFVFTRYQTPMRLSGEIGVVGPTRLDYTNIVPTVRYFGDLIEEIAKGW